MLLERMVGITNIDGHDIPAARAVTLKFAQTARIERLERQTAMIVPGDRPLTPLAGTQRGFEMGHVIFPKVRHSRLAGGFRATRLLGEVSGEEIATMPQAARNAAPARASFRWSGASAAPE